MLRKGTADGEPVTTLVTTPPRLNGKTTPNDGRTNAVSGASTGTKTPLGVLLYLKDATFADALLHVRQQGDGKSSHVPVHRIVLSYRSTFFHELFTAPYSAVSTNGLPIYTTPVLPAHPALHEVVALALWWIYSLSDDNGLPENKWEDIVGIYHLSEVFRLNPLAEQSARLLYAAMDRNAGRTVDELHTIWKEGRLWGCADVEMRAMDALLDLLVESNPSDNVLSHTSFETFMDVAERIDRAAHFDLIRRYVGVKYRCPRPLTAEQADTLWQRVPFEKLPAQELTSAFHDPMVPRQSILNAFGRILSSNHAALDSVDPELFGSVIKHASTPNASGTRDLMPSAAYSIVRSYTASHPDLDPKLRSELWHNVRFVDLEVKELERAFAEAVAPQDLMLRAMFTRLSMSAPPGAIMPPMPDSPPPSIISVSVVEPPTPITVAPPEKRASVVSKPPSVPSKPPSVIIQGPIEKADLDWTGLLRQKQGHWEDWSLTVTKKQMEEVVSSWNDLKRAGLVEQFGRLTKECLFSQNTDYERMYSRPESFPFVAIIDSIATQTHRSLNRHHREIVAELMLAGFFHSSKLGLSINDYKAMTVAVVFAMNAIHGHSSDSQRVREVAAWKALLSEMSVIMYRGEIITDQQRASLVKAAKHDKGEKGCRMM